MRKLLIAALCTALGCSTARAQLGPVQHIQVGPLDRSYIVERAGLAEANSRLPIIIYLHGLGTLISEGVPARFDIPFALLPELPSTLVVHPQGVDRRWDSIPARIKTWQRLAGTDGKPVDDIAFLRALIDHLAADENGDPTRVYVAGVSSGGFLVPRIACEMGDKVAAVADVIGTARQAVFKDCNAHPVPFALIASTTDDTNPYAGASGSELTRIASAPDTAFFFAKHDGCSTRIETPLPHLDLTLPSTVSLSRFSDCDEGSEVLFYRVDGSAHSVPSTAPIEAEGWNASGRRNRDIDTAHILWAFFKAHQRTAATPPG